MLLFMDSKHLAGQKQPGIAVSSRSKDGRQFGYADHDKCHCHAMRLQWHLSRGLLLRSHFAQIPTHRNHHLLIKRLLVVGAEKAGAGMATGEE